MLLLGLGMMIIGVARPHATVSVPREEATVILAMDVSRSMKADDVEPTRLDAARAAAKAFLAEVPEKYRVGVVSFATRAAVGVPPTEDRALVDAALDSLAPGEGTAIGDAVALGVELGEPTERTVEERLPQRDPPHLGRRAGRRPDRACRPPANGDGAQGVPVYTVLVGTPEGVVEEELTGGFDGSSACPRAPRRSSRSPPAPGGEFFAALDAEQLRRVYEELGSRLGRARGAPRDHGSCSPRGAAAFLLVGGHDVGVPVPEGPVSARIRARACCLATLAAALAVAAPAGGANECDGLMVCVPVAGPWVVVPTGGGVPRPQVEYQLTCPRGHVVGGLDAELSRRAIDVSFLGQLGSPVNPGITTSRSAVFVAAYVGAVGPRADASGRTSAACPRAGGGGRVPTSVTAFPPGRPTVRTREDRARAAGRDHRRPGLRGPRASRRRGARVRLLHAPAAEREPRLELSAEPGRFVDGRVRVAVRGDAELGGVRAVVQVQAVCSRVAR